MAAHSERSRDHTLILAVRHSHGVEAGGDWIAFHDLGDECLYVHVEQPDGFRVSIVAVTDVTPYEDIKVG
jgi:hypothetical protein